MRPVSAPPNHPLRRWFDIAAAAAAAVALLGALAWLAASVVTTRKESLAGVADAQRIAELRGEIVHLDEALTMAARMAAATGDPRWSERYSEA